VVLGIRPEHFRVLPGEMTAPIAMKINVIEPLGNEMDVYASTVLHDQVSRGWRLIVVSRLMRK